MSTPAAVVGACVVCGAPDPFGLGLCAQCGGLSHADADTLVALRPPGGTAAKRLLADRLRDLIGERVDTAEGRATTRGQSALLRLPRAIADRVASRLESGGIPARTVRASRAWTLMPVHFFVMLGAVLLVGGLAGAVVLPRLAWLTMLASGLLMTAAQRATRRPLLASPESPDALPDGCETALVNAFASLPAGTARQLLGELARLGRPLAAALARSGDPGGLATPLAELLGAAAATALEVGRLQSTLAALEESRAVLGGQRDADQAAETCARALDAGTARLREAATVLAGLASHAQDGVTDGTGTLAALTRQLEREARAQDEAATEVESLLRTTSPT